MKRILLLLLLLPALIKAQDTVSIPKLPIDPETHLITYQEIVDAPGIAKGDLYTRAREWFAENFKSANSVLQMDDKESGKLIGRTLFSKTYVLKAGFGVTVPQEYTVYYTINVTVKDNKFRTIVNNFRVNTGQGGQDSPAENLQSVIETFAGKMPMVSKKLKRSMQENAADVMLTMDVNGKACLREIKAALLNPKKDNF